MEPMTKHTILFLAANPRGTDPLALDREAHAIEAELERSGHRDRFELETWWATEPLDVLARVRQLGPAVVHFSGHGGQGGLVLHGPEDRARVVSTEAIAGVFEATDGRVKLVVLNGCYSEAQASALLAHVDHVVGLDGPVDGETARTFAIGFYGALGASESIEVACKQATWRSRTCSAGCEPASASST
jgi:hypothetical protein